MPYHHHGCRASVAWERGQGEWEKTRWRREDKMKERRQGKGEKTKWRREDKVLLPVFLSSVHFLTPSRSLKYRGSLAQGPRFLVHTSKVPLFVTQNSVRWQHAAKDPLTLPHECVTFNWWRKVWCRGPESLKVTKYLTVLPRSALGSRLWALAHVFHLVSSYLTVLTVGCGSTYLCLQHSGGWGRRIMGLILSWAL